MKRIGYWLYTERLLDRRIGVAFGWSHRTHYAVNWRPGVSDLRRVEFHVALGCFGVCLKVWFGRGAVEMPHHSDTTSARWQRKSGTTCHVGGCSACYPKAGAWGYAPAVDINRGRAA